MSAAISAVDVAAADDAARTGSRNRCADDVTCLVGQVIFGAGGAAGLAVADKMCIPTLSSATDQRGQFCPRSLYKLI